MAAELPAVVPGPVPPDDRDAWYAPDIRSQYHIGLGVVATVTETEDGFQYRTREPCLSDRAIRVRDRLEERFSETAHSRPLTREAAIERMEAGIPAQWPQRFDDLGDLPPAARRRTGYHLTAALRAFDALTALALDDRIRIGDTTGTHLTVHTRDFAPATTDLSAETPHLDRFLSERVATETVEFGPFEIPVTIVRRHLLGDDAFDRMYAVREPDLFPGDRELIETVIDRLVESPPGAVLEDPQAHVIDRARTLVRRRLRFRRTGSGTRSLLAPFEALGRRLGLLDPPLGPGTREERVSDLAYYVARDLVGDAELTVPIRDPRIGAVEANRVGERVTVVPHSGSGIEASRMPTTLSIDDDETFVGLARSLGAEGGVELSVHRPGATVEMERGVGEDAHSIHASVSVPTAGTDSGHISIRKQRVERRSPIQLVAEGVLSAGVVAGVWTVAANGGSVLFLGPPDAEPASVLEAHAPFIPADARPVGIDTPGRTVTLPHETAVTLSPAVPRPGKSTPAGKPEARDALHPDVVVFPDVTTEETMSQLSAELARGRSVVAAARTDSRASFVEVAAAAGISPSRLTGFDLVVELPPTDSDRDGRAWLPTRTAEDSGSTDAGEAPGTPGVEWDPLLQQNETETEHPELTSAFYEGRETGDDAAEMRQAFRRRVQYVTFLTDHEMSRYGQLLEFLADLRTDEAATIERIQRASE